MKPIRSPLKFVIFLPVCVKRNAPVMVWKLKLDFLYAHISPPSPTFKVERREGKKCWWITPLPWVCVRSAQVITDRSTTCSCSLSEILKCTESFGGNVAHQRRERAITWLAYFCQRNGVCVCPPECVCRSRRFGLLSISCLHTIRPWLSRRFGIRAQGCVFSQSGFICIDFSEEVLEFRGGRLKRSWR